MVGRMPGGRYIPVSTRLSKTNPLGPGFPPRYPDNHISATIPSSAAEQLLI
jgi:hypothetical protein